MRRFLLNLRFRGASLLQHLFKGQLLRLGARLFARRLLFLPNDHSFVGFPISLFQVARLAHHIVLMLLQLGLELHLPGIGALGVVRQAH